MSIKIQTDRLIIKKISKQNIDDLIKGLNNYNVSKWLIRVPSPYAIKDAKYWLIKSYNDELCLNIFKKNKLIGGISIDKRDNGEFNELGYWVNENYWGNGYAYEACESFLSYIFLNTSINDVYAGHMKDNIKSKKILIKLGFNKIGISTKYSISLKEEVEDVLYKISKSKTL